MQIYRDFAAQLFETNVNIEYYASRDDFTVTAERSNLIISEKFAVKSESRLYNGILSSILPRVITKLNMTVRNLYQFQKSCTFKSYLKKDVL